jgi:uncharacterized membrane protein
MNVTQRGSGESGLETAVSWLLIVGVVISLVLEIAGIAVYYHAYGELRVSTDPSAFIQGKNFFTFIYDQFRHGQGGAAARLMTAGIIILMLTPYVRVIVSTIYFARERNIKYVVITGFVVIVLTAALLRH